tara:strand:- start:5051 stop:6127 length:1077 start_codon:yes stop_codon:yes gene_type:complete
MSVYIIAEAGVNHNGSMDLALKLVDAAVYAKADAVKFQTYIADSLVTASAKKAKYQADLTGTNENQYTMLKRLELSQEQFSELQKYSLKKGIEFLSTAFDTESLRFLHNDLSINTLKIPSGEITNAPFLLEHAITGSDLIVSTGMSELEEIKAALSVIAYGYLHKASDSFPKMKEFKKAFSSKEGQLLLSKKVTLLHCTSEYPAPLEEVNLLAMNSMKDEFGLQVGYSDHTKGISVPIAAAALGARIIEKHFTLDSSMEGPDHNASLEPEELKLMIENIRSAELALGSNQKKVTESEFLNRNAARKSIVAIENIKKGDVLTESNIGIKRPGTGLSPFRYWETLGTCAHKEFNIGEDIE